MELSEIEQVHERFCRPGYGTTTPDELDYIQRLIRKHRPKRFIEIGTASGLTTGFIAKFLKENGGESVTSIDLRKTFFAEREKPIGYLAEQIYTGSDIKVELLAQKSTLDLSGLGGPWDMAFIDANHQHPWPTLDTLAVAPLMSGARIVIHHDLQLYRRYRRFKGVGPRILFNEMPEDHRHAVIANGWNIFSIDLNLTQEILEHVAIGALSMPWTDRPPISPRTLAAYEQLFAEHYSDNLRSEFLECVALNKVSLITKLAYYSRAFVSMKLRDWNLRTP